MNSLKCIIDSLEIIHYKLFKIIPLQTVDYTLQYSEELTFEVKIQYFKMWKLKNKKYLCGTNTLPYVLNSKTNLDKTLP